jgi:hypothetical protein
MGTVALIGLIVSVGLAYNIITDSLQTDIRKQQLQQVAENVAQNIVEIINLANFGNLGNGTLTRVLDLPSDLSGKVYLIQIVNDTKQQNNCYIKTCLDTRRDVTATSLIPLQSSQSHVDLITSNGTLAGSRARVIQYNATIYGGRNDTVVWAWKGTDITWAGIGRLLAGGG